MTVIEVGGIKEKGEDGNGKLSMSAGEGRGGGGVKNQEELFVRKSQ